MQAASDWACSDEPDHSVGAGHRSAFLLSTFCRISLRNAARTSTNCPRTHRHIFPYLISSRLYSTGLARDFFKRFDDRKSPWIINRRR